MGADITIRPFAGATKPGMLLDGRALYNTRSGHKLGDVEYAKAVVGRDDLFQIAVHDLDSHDGRLCRDQLSASGARPKFAAGMKDVSVSW
jgi:hypothetical protein